MNKHEVYKKIQEETKNRYQKRYQELGVVPRALGWGCREDQIQRFEVLCKYNDFNNKVILDIGCGFADFYRYLKTNNINCKYIGIDIISEFIFYCKNEFPEAEFYEKNILLDSNSIPEADYVISLGTLNFKLAEIENLVYTEDFIKLAYNKAKIKMITDFLSTNLTKDYPKEEIVYYHSPIDITNIAFALSNNVELIHNYKAIPQKEFMIMITKEE